MLAIQFPAELYLPFSSRVISSIPTLFCNERIVLKFHAHTFLQRKNCSQNSWIHYLHFHDSHHIFHDTLNHFKPISSRVISSIPTLFCNEGTVFVQNRVSISTIFKIFMDFSRINRDIFTFHAFIGFLLSTANRLYVRAFLASVRFALGFHIKTNLHDHFQDYINHFKIYTFLGFLFQLHLSWVYSLSLLITIFNKV